MAVTADRVRAIERLAYPPASAVERYWRALAALTAELAHGLPAGADHGDHP